MYSSLGGRACLGLTTLVRSSNKVSRRNVASTTIALLVGQPVVKYLVIPTIGRVARRFAMMGAKKSVVPKSRKAFAVTSIGYLVSVLGLSAMNVESTPVTDRKRVNIFSDEQYYQVSQFYFNVILNRFDRMILDESHPSCKRVAKLAARILKANEDHFPEFKGRKWTVTVVDVPMKNALVLSGGQIVVFKGLIDFVKSDDELGTILCHEMSHAILGHGAEIMSNDHMADISTIFVPLYIWFKARTIFHAAIGIFLFQQVEHVLLRLPKSRQIETEADDVGLFLAARACLDVRAAVAFWTRMDTLTNKDPGPIVSITNSIPNFLEYFSTHPSNSSRRERIESKLETVLKHRTICGCEELPSSDPRIEAEKELASTIQKNEESRRRKVVHVKSE